MSPRRKWQAAGAQRGAGSVELAIATPLLLLLILTVVQFAIWAHGVHCARAAALEALQAARVHEGTAAVGQTRAHRVLTQIGSGPLRHPHVRVQRSAATVRVTLTAGTQRVLPIPGLAPSVTVALRAPVERFIPAQATP